MDYEPRIGRIPIRNLSPLQPEDRWSAKAFAGEVVPFSATIFKEGHDQLGADLVLISPSGERTTHRLTDLGEGSDRWEVLAQLPVAGEWRWHIQAWVDEWATWLHNAEIKIPAGVDVPLMLGIGADLLKRAAKADPTSTVLKDAAKGFASKRASAEERLAIALDPLLTAEIERTPLAAILSRGEEQTLRVERARAGLGAWYEFFPRSEGAKKNRDGSWKSGTFRSAAKRLPAVAAMGFDVLYLPPIHPIGVSFRKGPNNTLNAGPNDPGSPWAIGSALGGHDAIHPDLGTEADFVTFLKATKKAGLELAIDLALQCSPDHPWVTEHPEWFTTLPDGSIAYAENPPKKYQDIYPLNFDNDFEGLSREVLRIVQYWIGLGVKIFRVDNPHTKPLQFWEWLLHEVNTEHPEIVFLAEAFTAPAMMYSLGQAGFQQSYTYFTWRNTKLELEEFLDGLAHETDAFFRPNLFVNTPDILTAYLQFGGVAAYKIRAAIAATASPSWGVYAGYELFENVARPGSEENIDNEKYEYKARDYAAAEAEGRSLAPYITRLNEIRHQHPALQQLRNLDVHWSDDDSILVYSKYIAPEFTANGSGDGIIVVANVDPHSVRETTVHLDPRKFGYLAGETFEVTDLLTGQVYTWGTDNYVRLDAFTEPVHILSIALRTPTATNHKRGE
ncbi:alpha-1,4-glucan--maltose-1-phosphate maltosyltransferase [Lacisediminihabitans changchengi]|uniref:Alpha-1,4-glucan:maltose-1-phosphate maltosyltransferase n=1 Tax=Lacisediminihabitans changchengi TaxID=2787634 RepID=A0A934W0S3_9MICO|nr:alpha-1,4-glucan--maltose-1-phosphate maltosyltransferase [Lacisediminihabitans changchengi]MBK4346143.1 alpha-1,4-glucan--maltose-1-phosphate maltosyltransferase [Lacisediminihabitans changchengi]